MKIIINIMIIAVLLVLILIGLRVPMFVFNKQPLGLKCRNNLKQLATATQYYFDEKGECPQSISQLCPDVITDEEAMEKLSVCPFSETSYRSIFEFLDHPLKVEFPADVMIAWDMKPHKDGSFNVVFADTYSESVDEARCWKLLTQSIRKIQKLEDK